MNNNCQYTVPINLNCGTFKVVLKVMWTSRWNGSDNFRIKFEQAVTYKQCHVIITVVMTL